MHPRTLTTGHCGASVMTPFVLTPTGNCRDVVRRSRCSSWVGRVACSRPIRAPPTAAILARFYPPSEMGSTPLRNRLGAVLGCFFEAQKVSFLFFSLSLSLYMILYMYVYIYIYIYIYLYVYIYIYIHIYIYIYIYIHISQNWPKGGGIWQLRQQKGTVTEVALGTAPEGLARVFHRFLRFDVFRRLFNVLVMLNEFHWWWSSLRRKFPCQTRPF